ncbi:DUF4168 domain-containing protein [Sphingomonas sp. HT-1]|uniref:DUF4168 domain-containing protein n=1 Tax=unclassified Sphingomonas TaxID=196159 RepID=UPI000AF0D565|nr:MULTISPECIES: DUF4168 domain-containing protein [unclassified Sphingomonas]
MKMLFSTMAAAGALMATGAMAQTTPAQPPMGQTAPGQTMPSQSMPSQTAPTQAAPDAAAPATTATSAVSDTEVKQYAAAALAVNKISTDTTVPEAEKNTRFVAAITTSGLQPQRFNEISQAMAADPALNQRIQAAAAQVQTSGQSAQASTPSGPSGN